MTTRRRHSDPPEGMAPLLSECRHCHGFFHPEDARIEDVCPTCEGERYEECPECRQLRMRDVFVAVEGGQRVCRTCANGIAFRCAECGRWLRSDEVGHITDRRGM